MEKALLKYLFTYICQIEPSKNIEGTIKEFYPEKINIKDYKLHKYGSGPFCRFSIPVKWARVMGVYAIYFNDELMYIGQCIDLAKRYNLGYGQIQPRNCFAKGQSTNCKINKLILEAVKSDIKVELYFYQTSNYDEVESKLIEYYNPVFNKKRGRLISNEKKVKLYANKSLNKNTNFTSTQLGVNDVYKHIEKIIERAKEKGEKCLELISGEIHRELGLVQRMPTVCDAMYKIRKPGDVIIYSPPKGKGSRLHIRYYL